MYQTPSGHAPPDCNTAAKQKADCGLLLACGQLVHDQLFLHNLRRTHQGHKQYGTQHPPTSPTATRTRSQMALLLPFLLMLFTAGPCMAVASSAPAVFHRTISDASHGSSNRTQLPSSQSSQSAFPALPTTEQATQTQVPSQPQSQLQSQPQFQQQHSQQQHDEYDRLVLQSSFLHGHVRKQGMLPLERWNRSLFNPQPFHLWLRLGVLHGMRDGGEEHPQRVAGAAVMGQQHHATAATAPAAGLMGNSSSAGGIISNSGSSNSSELQPVGRRRRLATADGTAAAGETGAAGLPNQQPQPQGVAAPASQSSSLSSPSAATVSPLTVPGGEAHVRGPAQPGPVPLPAPLSHPCALLVNHRYKFILIRNRKAASSSLLHALNATCRHDPASCLQHLGPEQLQARGLTPQEAWRQYFVITTSRNPWSRAASGFGYIPLRWTLKRNSGGCHVPLFPDFCRDPYILGKLHQMYKCSDDSLGYYYFHVEPSSKCITTAEGHPAVDFVIRHEHLHQDFAEALAAINARRDPGVPELRSPGINWHKRSRSEKSVKRVQHKHHTAGAGHNNTSSVLSSSANAFSATGSLAAVSSPSPSTPTVVVDHSDKYRKCGVQCVRDVARFYEEDLRLYGFSMPEGFAEQTAR